jgi:hypothetical protein
MKRGDTVLMIKHGRFAADRILSASKASSLLLDYRSDFLGELKEDSLIKRDSDDVQSFIEHMLPLVPVTPERPRAKMSNDRIIAQREEFFNDYYLAADNLRYEGTRLGILNAYYDWITHHVPARTSGNYDDVKFSNLLNGTAVSNKLIENA